MDVSFKAEARLSGFLFAIEDRELSNDNGPDTPYHVVTLNCGDSIHEFWLKAADYADVVKAMKIGSPYEVTASLEKTQRGLKMKRPVFRKPKAGPSNGAGSGASPATASRG